MYLLGILNWFQRNIFRIKELLIDLEKTKKKSNQSTMKPWRYSLYTFNNDSTPILTYRHNLALVLILHSHLEHFDDLSFFGAIWVTRNIFLKPNFTQFSPTHFFSLKKPSRFFLKTFNWTFVAFFLAVTESHFFIFKEENWFFFFHGRIHIDPKWIS